MRISSLFRKLRNRGRGSSNSVRRPASKTRKPQRGFFESLEQRALLSTVTTTTVTASAATAISGQPVTLSAAVDDASPLMVAPSGTIDGVNTPNALAFDSSGNLFVGNAGAQYEPNNGGTTVSEFAADSLAAGGNIAPVATLTGLNSPAAMAFDASGNLFVANGVGNTVSEFSAASFASGKSSIAPTATLVGLSDPIAIAFDSSGNVFVANREFNFSPDNSVVSEFSAASVAAGGDVAATTALTAGAGGATALAFDPSGNLWVGNFYAGTVSEFAAASLTGGGRVTPVATPITLPGSPNWPAGMAFDSHGNLYVVSGDTVSEYAANSLSAGGSISPTTTLVGLNDPGSLAFDSSGNLYVNNFFGNTVSEFAANSLTGGGSVSPTATLGDLNNPGDIAVDTAPGASDGDLFATDTGNGTGTTVSEFSAASLAAATPTGNVDFVDSTTGADLGTASLANGVAVLPNAALPTGTYAITATYNGIPNVFADSSAVLGVGASTVALTASPTNPAFGQAVMLTATVTDLSGGETPTGNVDFFDSSENTDLGTAALGAGGVATLTTTGVLGSSGVGNVTITAEYSGDANFGANSGSADATVLYPTPTALPTTTTMQASPAMAASGQPVTLTATVAAQSPSGVAPAGTVDFVDATTGSELGPPVNLINGVATLPGVDLPTGTNGITARYSGNDIYGASASTFELGVGVNTLPFSVSPAVSNFDQPVTLTFTVPPDIAGANTPVPTGSVDFFDTSENLDLGTAPLNASGVATLTTSGQLGSSGIANPIITASYAGDANYAPYTASAETTIVYATTTSLQASAAVVTAGQPVSFTATVAVQSPGTGTPDGTVAFVNAATGADLDTVNLANGVANLSNLTFPAGTYTIAATYSGDTANSFVGSTGYADVQVRSLYGGPLTVSVQAPNGETVTFEDGNTPIGTATSMDGTASLTTSALPPGTNDIRAEYSGSFLPGSTAIGPQSIITTVAGGGSGVEGGEMPTSASVYPADAVADSSGNVYIADSAHDVIWEISAGTGLISTIAGNWTAGASGDGGAATALAIDNEDGLLFIADADDGAIEELNLSSTSSVTLPNGRGALGPAQIATVLGGPASIDNVTLNLPNNTLPGYGYETMAALAYDQSKGILYVADNGDNQVLAYDPTTGNITTIAGDGTADYSSDGGPATQALLNGPSGLAVDAAGDLYIADTGNNVVREVNTGASPITVPGGATLQPGDITTIAGNYTAGGGYSGDGQAATAAQLSWPSGLAVDSAGDLFIADTGNSVIREVYASSGQIATIAGLGTSDLGDGGSAIEAQLSNQIVGLSFDSAGDLLISDSNYLVGGRVREIESGEAITVSAVTTTTLSRLAASQGMGGPVTLTATVTTPDSGVPSNVAPTGSVDFVDITTNTDLGQAPVVNGVAMLTTDQLANIGWGGQADITADYGGDINFFAANSGSSLVTVVPATTMSLEASPTVALSGQTVTLTATVTDAPGAGTLTEGTVEFDIYQNANLVRSQPVQLDGANVAIATFSTLPAGTYTVTAAYSDPASNYASSSAALGLAPTIITVAGNGIAGDGGDGGPAQGASIALGNGTPTSVAVDAAGDLFIADAANNAIREVSPSGQISTVASGLDQPQGVAVDAQGNLYIAVTGANVVQMLNLTGNTETLFGQTVANGGMITIAGDGSGYSRIPIYEGQAATIVPVASPEAVAVDNQGDVFIAVGDVVKDPQNHYYQNAILEVSPDDTLELKAGIPSPGQYNSPFGSTSLAYDATTQRLYFSMEGLATDTPSYAGLIGYFNINQGPPYLANPEVDTVFTADVTGAEVGGLAVDAAGDVYVANSSNNSVEELAAPISGIQGYNPDVTDGNIAMIAGNGTAGNSGDDGPATLAALSDPTGLAVNAAGDLFIVDTGNYRVREVLSPSPLQVLTATQISDVTASDLDTVAAASPSFTLQAPTANDLTNLLTAVNALTPPTNNGTPQPVTVTLDLGSGTYNDADIALQSGVTLVIVGNGTSTTFVGHSPALTLTTGILEVENASFSTASDSPTIVVSGGSLTLGDDTVASSSGSNEPAFEVTGGTVDLGDDDGNPGGNTLEVNGGGQLAYNTSGVPISVVGDTVELNGTLVSPPPTTLAPATVTVTTATDSLDSYSDSVGDLQNAAAASDPVSLRDAITALDTALSGPNTIDFNITTGSGPHVIDVLPALGELPAITVPTIIDGYSQNGASPNTAAIGQADTAQIEIEIDGLEFPYDNYSTTDNGLTIDSGHCVVQGLSIIGFAWGTAIQIGTDAGDVGNVIAGNFIGTTGDVSGGNGDGISPGNYTLIGSSAQFGAVDAAGDNVGIDDSTISAAIANELNVAMGPYTSSTGTLFAAEENVISGNYIHAGQGVGVGGGQNDVIAGNLIGPDKTGTQGIGNSVGISAGEYDLIGGTVPGTENIISGNGGNIPVLANSDFYTDDVQLGSHDELAGNVIGAQAGAVIGDPASAQAISGQADIGVLLEGQYFPNSVANTIEDNLISGHALSGISIAYGDETDNVVEDNTIENNGYVGIGIIANTAENQFVGNTITDNGSSPDGFSGGPGIAVVSDGIYTADGNSFLQNSISGNSGSGINLGGIFYFNQPAGSPNYTPGNGTPDYGANNYQNPPTITSAETDGHYTEVTGNFNATADGGPNPGNFQLDFYANGPDGSGQIWLGSIPSNGMEGFTANFTAVPMGDTITATATNLTNGDTSEFATPVTVISTSAPITVSPANTTTGLSVSSTVVLTGQPVTLTATVTATAGTPDGSVTFYDNGTAMGSQVPLNADGTATLNTALSNTTTAAAPQDITAQYNGDQINFNSSTSGSVEVQVVPDLSVTDSTIDANLQTAVQTAATDEAAASQPATVALQAATADDASGLITALNSVVEPTTVNNTAEPVTATLDLAAGATYSDADIDLQPGVTLVIVDNGIPSTFTGHSPALTVNSGNVIVEGFTLNTATQAPTILVTGGNLTLLNDMIESSTGYTEPAIEIDGGTVNLGTAANPDTLVINGTGEFIENNTSSPVSTVGDTLIQATPVITWPTPANITYGTALCSAQLDATANVPGTFTYTPAAGTVLQAGTDQTLSVTFTPADTTDYTTATNSVMINVNKATPTITWHTPPSITYGTALGSTQLDATANVTGTFVYAPAASTVLKAGMGQTLSVTFTPANTTDYTAATDSVMINVNRATPAITWANPASITSGMALGSTQLDASANVAGAFVYTPLAGTVLPAGTGQTLSVTFTPTDATDYTTATDSVTINVIAVIPGSIYVLDPTAGGALSLSGNASINTSGNVVVDSNSTSAILASGNATVTAAAGVQVVGGVSKSGNAKVTKAGSPAATGNPLAGLAAPTIPSYTGNPISESLSGNSTATISQGSYSQISVSGNAKLTLNPGVYVIGTGGVTVSGNASLMSASSNGSGVTYIVEGGGFAVSGNANLSGANVLVDNTTSGSTSGSISLSGNGTFSLSAASTGPDAGVLIYQPAANTKALSFSGNAMAGLAGTVDAPAAALVLSGNAKLVDTLIVDTLSISGNAVAQLTAANGGNVYTPAQIRTAYGINDLALDGAGQTIAIVDAYDDPQIYQALDAFDSQFGIATSGPTLYQQYGPATSFLTVLNQSGQATSLPGTDPIGPGNDNWEVEESLDVEWAHAIAPGAKIILVEANSQSLADLMAGVATAAGQPGVSTVSMSWGFAEGQGVSSADEAAYDGTFAVPGVTFVASTGDYGAADPVYPAFSPNVLAVGGTSLSLNADSSYGGESGWGYFSTAAGAFIGSGGGLSQNETEPEYQEAVQSTGSRTTPDVSFVADPATGAWVADPYNLDPSNPWEVVGGTSLSAPCWSGLIALVDQGRSAAGKPALNSASPTETQQSLYSLSQNDYHVITSGSNGYTAAAGYNLVTGLGTPVANLVVPDLVAGNFPATGLVPPASVAALVNAGATGGNASSPANAMDVFDALTMQGSTDSGSATAEAPAALSQKTPTAQSVTIGRANVPAGALFAVEASLAGGSTLDDGSNLPNESDTRDWLFANSAGLLLDDGPLLESLGGSMQGNGTGIDSLGPSAGGIGIAEGAIDTVRSSAQSALQDAGFDRVFAELGGDELLDGARSWLTSVSN